MRRSDLTWARTGRRAHRTNLPGPSPHPSYLLSRQRERAATTVSTARSAARTGVRWRGPMIID